MSYFYTYPGFTPWWLDLAWDRSAEGYPWARFDLPVTPAVDCCTWAHHWAAADLTLSWEEAACYCQLTLADLDALAEAGLLRAAWGPLPSGPSRWSFSERGLHRSLRAVLGAVPVRPLAEIPAPVADLVWILAQGARRNVGIATILRAVQDGTLSAFRTRPTVQLCDLWFTCAVATAYLDDEQQATLAPRGRA